MYACANPDKDDLAADVSHYRCILRRRTRYYLAQREAGVPAVSAPVLDLVILSNLEGCFMDVATLAGVMDIPRTVARERVVELISGGWIEVRQTEAGAGLYVTEKAATFADDWIGIADAA